MLNYTQREEIPQGEGFFVRAATSVPRTARSRRTRAALLDGAWRLIATEGFESLTMAAVAASAGVSRRAVYLHFRSRGELVTSLFEHVNEIEGLAASLGRVWEANDSLAALKEWAAHLARFHPRVLPVSRATERVRRTDPDVHALWEIVMDDRHRACRRLAGWLKREGRLASPWTARAAADMLWALMSDEVLEGLLSERGWTPRRYGEYMETLLVATFVGRSDGDS